MAIYRKKIGSGFSLMEVIIAMAILTVTVSGVFSCEFFVVKNAKQARAEMLATRTAQLLLEDWKAYGGKSDYDPAAMNSGITDAGSGKYLTIVDNLPIYFSLSSNDVSTWGNTTLRQISVNAGWRSDFSQQLPGNDDCWYSLTTYCH